MGKAFDKALAGVVSSRSDFHVHTHYCDGKDSPRDMVLSGISKGLDTIGIVCHSYLPGEEDWCIRNHGYDAFISEISALKSEFSNRINILCGVEHDMFSKDVPSSSFDYVIGAVHMIETQAGLVSIDWKPEITSELCMRHFSGDWMALCGRYYETLSRVVEATDCDIIAHFDLISKFNQACGFFDESRAEYETAWKRCADALLGSGRRFEINTGAISRGCRTEQYPSNGMIGYLKRGGAGFVFSSDAHEVDAVAFGFDALPTLV